MKKQKLDWKVGHKLFLIGEGGTNLGRITVEKVTARTFHLKYPDGEIKKCSRYVNAEVKK